MTELATTTRSLVIERVMPHPPGKIWWALTQGPLIEEWLMKNDFQPVVGHRFNFRATPPTVGTELPTAWCWRSFRTNV